jgi:hypothetical protein
MKIGASVSKFEMQGAMIDIACLASSRIEKYV